MLADALAYADAELDPDVVVDVATLTGAARSALGRRHGGALRHRRRGSPRRSTRGGGPAASGCGGCRSSRTTAPRSTPTVADLANISRDPQVGGGSITAALFLREFAGGRPWAHLDIAGRAAPHGRRGHEVTKGATGFGARLLLRWLDAQPAPEAAHGAAASESRLTAASSPSPTGSSSAQQPLVLADGLAELADGHGLGVALRGVGDPVVPERVVEGHDAAGPQQPQRLARGSRRTRACRRRRTPGRRRRR